MKELITLIYRVKSLCGITSKAVVAALMILLTTEVNAQLVRLWSEIEVEENSNLVSLRWEGIEGVNKLQYRLLDVGDWKTISATNQFARIARDLKQDKTYQWRLIYNGEPGQIHYFRTYKIIQAKGPLEQLFVLRASEASRHHPQKIFSDRVQFLYRDNYHLADKALLGDLYDYEGNLVSRIAFKKTEDHVYEFEPSKLNVIWELDKTYSLNLHDNHNPRRQIKFQLSEPLGEDLEAEISANPVVMDCRFGTFSKIEYYGTFEGGNPPYEVVWSIADADDFSEPLMEPTKMIIEKNTHVAKVTIEYPLPYMVVFSVLDGCGNFGEHSVVIQCTEEDEDEFSLLFESIDSQNDDLSQPGSKR